MPIKRKISEFKPLFTNLAQTSHYEVKFGGLPSQLLAYLSRKGITSNFIYNDVGLLCFSTQLPATSFALATINGNNMGLTEKFGNVDIAAIASPSYEANSAFILYLFPSSSYSYVGRTTEAFVPEFELCFTPK